MASSGCSGLALLEKLSLTAKEKKEFKQASRLAKREINILVAGKTGAGKSKLVNALSGAIVATEGHGLRPQTAMLDDYVAQSRDGYTIVVRDSPGLQDGTGKDLEYLQEMKSCDVDVLLYCIDMSEIRVIVSELSPGMTLLTEALGQDIWRHAIVVLTYANVVAERIAKAEESLDEGALKCKFLAKVRDWRTKVSLSLRNAGIPGEIVKHVAIQPAGDYLNPGLPDRIHWLGYLWLVFLHQMKEEAKFGILVNNENRIYSAEYLQPVGTDSSSVKLPKILIAIEWLAELCHERGIVGQLCSSMIRKVLENRQAEAHE